MLPESDRKKILSKHTEMELAALLYDWQFWARPKQIPPPELDTLKNIWLILAGRGWGKSRTGAEFVRDCIAQGYQRGALVAPTAADARDVMVEGESGLMAICPPDNMPDYEPSKRRLTWPNGALCTLYAAEKPDRLRGPQHDFFWADELAAWKYVQETWDMLMFGLRLGIRPKGVVTTTPRPIKTLKELLKMGNVITTKGGTLENRGNLAPSFFTAIIDKYQGTRLGRQELDAEILDDNPDALWSRKQIEDLRVNQAPDLVRVVVAIDPQATNNPNSAETGIVVAGKGRDGHGYVLDDVSIKGTPDQWASRAVNAYHEHKADRIIGEANNGGDMVEYTVRTIDRHVPYKKVHASRGKLIRAEPISALYEQGKIHHIGMFALLEDQMCEWVPGDTSPDRLDALVWAMTELMLGGGQLNTMPKSALGL